MKTYTVVLAYPEYARLNKTGDPETFMAHVMGDGAQDAIREAREECCLCHSEIKNPQDMFCVCVFEGLHYDSKFES